MEASAIPAPAARRSPGGPSGRFLRLRSDEQLVALFRAGDEAAFQAIYHRYRQRLFAYARQMLGGSRQDAEDALQDVFLRAYGALRADERPISLRAWLYRVAHNRCIDHLRRPTPPAAEVFALTRRPLHDPIEEAERREDLRRLIADVRGLPAQQRSALLMRELDGLSYAELADALDVTVPAVKSLLVRARIGLVEAAEARDAACVEIRESLALSHGRGVRASGLARRHMRECSDCRRYRDQLKAVRAGMAALNPAPLFGPLACVAQMVGCSGAGTSAAAGGGLAIAGGGTVVTKAAVVVCAAAVTAGGAIEVRHRIAVPAPAEAVAKAAPTPGATRSSSVSPSGIHWVEPLALPAVARLTASAERPARDRGRSSVAKVEPAPAGETISPHEAPSPAASAPSGGAVAPHEASTPDPPADTHAPALASQPSPTPVTAADASPLAAQADDPTALDEPTVESVAGGAIAPRR